MDKLNTNTEMEEMINDFIIVSPLQHFQSKTEEIDQINNVFLRDGMSSFCFPVPSNAFFQLKQQNDREAESIDRIFTERRE